MYSYVPLPLISTVNHLYACTPLTTPTLFPARSRIGPCSMCSSKCAPMGVASWLAGTDPRYPMRRSSDSTVAGPATSRDECARERGILPAQTPEDIMLMGKRAPSSLRDVNTTAGEICETTYFVQFTTPTGNSVSTSCSRRISSISTPATTPRMPSYRPPVGCVSR